MPPVFSSASISRAVISNEANDLSGRRRRRRPNPARRRRENAWRFAVNCSKGTFMFGIYGRVSLLPCSGSGQGAGDGRLAQQPVTLTVRVDQPGARIDPYLLRSDDRRDQLLLRRRTLRRADPQSHIRDNPQSPVNWSVVKPAEAGCDFAREQSGAQHSADHGSQTRCDVDWQRAKGWRRQ